MKLSKGLVNLTPDSGVGTYLIKLEDMCIEQKKTINEMQETFKSVIDDLVIRAKLSGDDSLDISQGLLDKINTFIGE